MRSPDATELDMAYQIERAERCRSLGQAITACIHDAGLDFDKQVSAQLGYDKAQLSRWQSDAEGIKSEKLKRIMDWCGNVIPLLFLVGEYGFETRSMHRKESLVEKQNRELREENAALRRVLMSGAR